MFPEAQGLGEGTAVLGRSEAEAWVMRSHSRRAVAQMADVPREGLLPHPGGTLREMRTFNHTQCL